MRRGQVESPSATAILASFAAWVLAVTAGCAPPPVTRTVSVPEKLPVTVTMTVEQAAIIDPLVEAQPDSSDLEACQYWKKKILTIFKSL